MVRFTSVDWMVYYNNHMNNLIKDYGMKERYTETIFKFLKK